METLPSFNDNTTISMTTNSANSIDSPVTSSFLMVVIIIVLVLIADCTIIFLVIKERLWRDDNALLILNLMFSFLIYCLWHVSIYSSDHFHWQLGLPFLFGFQIMPHISVLVTLGCMSVDRVLALRKKTMVKIYSRSYAARRILLIWLFAISLAGVTSIAAYSVDGQGDAKTEIFFHVYIICHFASSVLTIFISVIAFVCIWKIHSRVVNMAITKGTINDPIWQKTNKVSSRLTVTVAALVFGQFTTWFAIYIYLFLNIHRHLLEIEQEPVFVFLLLTNFIVAPLMVFLGSAQFRRYFKRQFLCCLYPDLMTDSYIDESWRSSARRTLSMEEG